MSALHSGPGTPEVSPNNQIFSALPEGSFAEDAPAAQIHQGVAPESGDIVVSKKRVSAFAGSDLDMVPVRSVYAIWC